MERSLRDLKTDYLDIVLIHSDGRDLHIIEATDCLPTLMSLKAKGLIRAVGMSTKTVEGGLRAAELTDVVMVTFNPSARDDAAVIDRAHTLKKGVLIKKALNSGHDCEGIDRSAANNIRYSLGYEGVSSVIVGTLNPDHLTDNVAAAME